MLDARDEEAIKKLRSAVRRLGKSYQLEIEKSDFTGKERLRVLKRIGVFEWAEVASMPVNPLDRA